MICKYEAECDYYVFWNNECCFGKFSHASGSQFTTSTSTVYFKIGNEELTVSNFYDPKNGDQYDSEKGLMDDSYWKRGIYTYMTDSSDLESRCAKRCLVTDDGWVNFLLTNTFLLQACLF